MDKWIRLVDYAAKPDTDLAAFNHLASVGEDKAWEKFGPLNNANPAAWDRYWGHVADYVAARLPKGWDA